MMCKARAVGSGMETPRPTASSPKWSGNPQRRPRAPSQGAVAAEGRRRLRARGRRKRGRTPRLQAALLRSFILLRWHRLPPISSPILWKAGCIRSLASVVLVSFLPKDHTALADAINQLIPTSSSEPAEVARERMEKNMEESKIERCATGFVLEGAPEGEVNVLTCAHTLDYLFTPTSPLTPATIDRLFKVRILCDHAECNYRQKIEGARKYIPVTVLEVDSSKDLVLLRVTLSVFRRKCKESHRPLKIARKFPDPLERIVMISWPPFRPRTACAGETSHPSRGYANIMTDAPDAHSTKLSEVNILGDRGSSGAPLLDGAAEVAGFFHSGSLGTLSFSYFISFNELRNILISWGRPVPPHVRTVRRNRAPKIFGPQNSIMYIHIFRPNATEDQTTPAIDRSMQTPDRCFLNSPLPLPPSANNDAAVS